MSDEDLVTITTSNSVDEAEGVRLLLAQEGIDAMVMDGNTVVANWFYGPAVGYIKVQVMRSQAEAAVAILKQHPTSVGTPAGSEDQPATCLNCGTPMPEGTDACPKCGWTFDVAEEPEEEAGE